MIFDSLNINDNELLSKNKNSQTLSLTPSNGALNDDGLSETDKSLFDSEDKVGKKLSFTEQLQVVTHSNDIIIEQQNLDVKLEDGNPLPSFDKNIDSQDDNTTEFKITKFNDAILNINSELSSESRLNTAINATVSGVINTKVNAKETNVALNLVIEGEVSVKLNLSEKDVIITQNPIQKGEGLLVKNIAVERKVLDGEKLINIDSSKSTFNRPVTERLNLDILNREPQSLISKFSVSEEIVAVTKTNSHGGNYSVTPVNFVAKQLLDIDVVSLAKEKEVNYVDKTLLNKSESGFQEFDVSKLSSLLNVKDAIKPGNNDLNLKSAIPGSTSDAIVSTLNPSVNQSLNQSLDQVFNPSLSLSLKPIVEPSLLAEQIIFKQALNANAQFANGLGVRIQWMLQQALSSAEIMLDPPELGPLNVKLVQAGSETNIVFQVNTLQGKEALEDNLAKLKEMLLAQGLTLGETEIQHKQKENEQQAQSDQESDSVLNEDDEINQNGRLSSNMAILDTYI